MSKAVLKSGQTGKEGEVTGWAGVSRLCWVEPSGRGVEVGWRCEESSEGAAASSLLVLTIPLHG